MQIVTRYGILSGMLLLFSCFQATNELYVDNFDAIELDNIKYIVWDLGSTLTCVHNMSVAYEMGLRHILSMFWHIGRPSKMRECMFDVLEKYAGKQQAPHETELMTYDDTDTPLPHFMSDWWFCSRLTDDQIRDGIVQAVAQWKPTEPNGAKKKELIKKTLLTALSARILGKHIVFVKKMLEVVRLCKQKGYTQYIFSNIDKECFEKAYNNPLNKELFSFFPREHIIISGDCQMIKPHRVMYNYFLDTFKLNPQECLLIDDRPENTVVAQEYGMQTLLVAHGKYRKFARKFKRLLQQVA